MSSGERDDTVAIRRDLTAATNTQAAERAELKSRVGQVWNSEEAFEEFQFLDFYAPFVVVLRKSDGVKGSLLFQHYPRYYFGFKPQED